MIVIVLLRKTKYAQYLFASGKSMKNNNREEKPCIPSLLLFFS